MTAAMAERFGQRPSDLLAIPAEDDWARYCIDEALHVLHVGHQYRDRQWEERFRKDPDSDAPDLYEKHRREGLGKPPSTATLDALRYASEHSGRGGNDE